MVHHVIPGVRTATEGHSIISASMQQRPQHSTLDLLLLDKLSRKLKLWWSSPNTAGHVSDLKVLTLKLWGKRLWGFFSAVITVTEHFQSTVSHLCNWPKHNACDCTGIGAMPHWVEETASKLPAIGYQSWMVSTINLLPNLWKAITTFQEQIANHTRMCRMKYLALGSKCSEQNKMGPM